MTVAARIPNHCYHCGETNPARAFLANTPSGPVNACCPGCAAAIETVFDLGLADYYQVREGQPEPVDALDQAHEFALFAIEELVAPHRRATATGEKLELQLSGLTCAACSWLIEKALTQQPGVERALVNLAGMRLTVEGAAPLDAAAIAQCIHKLGYQAHLPSAKSHALHTIEKAQKVLTGRLILAGLGAMQAMMYATALYMGVFEGQDAVFQWVFRIASFVVATPVIFYAGWPFLQGAFNSLRYRRLTMDTPIALALLLAWSGSLGVMAFGGEHVYFDSAAMFVFFLLISRWLEQRQQVTMFKTQHQAMQALPQAVRIATGTDESHWVSLQQVKPGDDIVLMQGETVPVDGVLAGGQGEFDEAAFSGESLPVNRQAGEAIHAGTLLVQGSVTLTATHAANDSMIAKIQDQVDRAQHERSDVVRDWQRVAPFFTGAVLLLAAFTLFYHRDAGLALAFERTLAVLVITCPCALALAVPLSLSATLSTALREGILIASPKQFLRLPSVGGIMFDKTGTLTYGQFEICHQHVIRPNDDRATLQRIAAALEWQQPHPLALPFQAFERHQDVCVAQSQRTGIQGTLNEAQWRIGAADPALRDAHTPATMHSATCLQLSENGHPRMLFWLRDQTRDDAAPLVQALQHDAQPAFTKKLTCRIASGDAPAPVRALALALGINEWRAQQSPEQKAAWLTGLEQDQAQMMVGDGINDAPAMLAASVSVATGNATSLAHQAAGIYLLNDDLSSIAALPALSRQCQRKIRQNLGWAIGYNLVALPFAVAGIIPPWAAAIGMSLSSFLVTFNASRIRQWKL